MDFGYTFIDDAILRAQASKLQALASEYMDLIASVRREQFSTVDSWQSASGERWGEKVLEWAAQAQNTVNSMRTTASGIIAYADSQRTLLEKLLDALKNDQQDEK